ncbi:MAG: penicillin acylase family protein [Pseudomonadales bacterium]
MNPRLLPLHTATLCGLLAWSALSTPDAAFAVDTPDMGDVPTLTYRVDGLSQDAEILVDHWGVPHIYAGTHYDAFFVQGFNAARDRLWQIDTWRRRGLGLLAEVLGEAYAEQDRAARLFLYRGDMRDEWLAYGSDAKRIAESFTDGINTYVQLIDEHPELLPPEFELLGYTPSLWAAADVVRIRSNGLWRNVASEVRRARIACELGLAAASLEKVLEPAWETRIPDGFEPCTLPDGVIDDYLLATAPVSFAALTETRLAADVHRARLLAESETRSLDGQLGSNNWVVAPGRTDTGRPILADDPHRGHAVPSLRYIAHLTAPGLDVIGAGEPALPGISIGHNDRIAFGLTIFPIDQEDLYVYQRGRLRTRADGVKDDRDAGYLYRGRAEPLTTVEETIPVKGGPGRNVTLTFTRHGPVVYETKDALYAVRAAWLEPGMSPYFGSVEYMRARNWRQFVAALNRWGAPSENQVYADIDGNIGYKPAGLFPRRINWDGLLPVPGDGRYEWDGFFDMDALPEEYNPPRNFAGTANAMNLPKGYPIAERRIGFEWSAPWRFRRLWEVLASQPRHSLVDSHDLQRDYHSVLAREVIARLPSATAHPNRPALAMLKSWDATLTPDSAPAALYAVWFYRYLERALLDYRLPGASSMLTGMDSLAVLETLGDPGAATPALTSLDAAWAETMRLLGDDPAAWQWGNLHRTAFEHPLLTLAPPGLAAAMRYPDYPRGGTANTTNNTGFGKDDFLVRSGASYRMVLDVGRWDDAEMTNAPGQSGDPRSPFYGNLLEGWATDSSFPLLYSREAVEANQALKIVLQAARGLEAD